MKIFHINSTRLENLFIQDMDLEYYRHGLFGQVVLVPRIDGKPNSEIGFIKPETVLRDGREWLKFVVVIELEETEPEDEQLVRIKFRKVCETPDLILLVFRLDLELVK